MANKVKFGLKNVHVWPITEASAETVTYGTVIKVPGAVELSLDAAGEDNKFYADDIVYWNQFSNNGYEGDLEIALVPKEYKIEILGDIEDANGVLIESNTARPKNYAMAFEFDGDANQTRHILYNCSSSRPAVASRTKEETVEPVTETLTISASPAMDTGFIKASIDAGQTGYEEFLTTPYIMEPVVPGA